MFIKRILVKGMTLPELLVVVMILSILMLLSFLAVQNQLHKGYDSRRKTDIYQIKVAVEEYEKDHNCYPTSVVCKAPHNTDLMPYIPEIPCDPQTHESYLYAPDGSSSCPRWFYIFADLDNNQDPKIDELGCSNGCGTPQLTVFDYYVSSPNAPPPSFGSVSTSPPPASIPDSGYFGCFGGVCEELEYDVDGGGLECSPSYARYDCYSNCINPDTGLPQNECK